MNDANFFFVGIALGFCLGVVVALPGHIENTTPPTPEHCQIITETFNDKQTRMMVCFTELKGEENET